MLVAFLLSLMGPLAIFIGLIVLKNAYWTFFLYHGLVCIGIPITDLWILKRAKPGEIKRILALSCQEKAVKTGVGLGILFLTAIIAFFYIFKSQTIHIRQLQELMLGWKIKKDDVLFLLFVMIFANSVLEEIFWRGYIFNRFMKYLDARRVILITSLFYASYHFITTMNLFSRAIGILFTLVIFMAGLFWGFLRHKFDSILTPIISHLMADLAIMIIYLIFVQKRLIG
jgi:membrane protease YdiL (CAAX protease family)